MLYFVLIVVMMYCELKKFVFFVISLGWRMVVVLMDILLVLVWSICFILFNWLILLLIVNGIVSFAVICLMMFVIVLWFLWEVEMLRKMSLLVFFLLYVLVSLIGLLVFFSLRNWMFLIMCFFFILRYGMICFVIMCFLFCWVFWLM